MATVTVVLDSANGPKVTVEGELETSQVLAELPNGWTVHDDDWNNGVKIGHDTWAYPLSVVKPAVALGRKGGAVKSAAKAAAARANGARGGRPSAVERLRSASSLDELLRVLNSLSAAQLRDNDVEQEMCELPTFGGREPRATLGVWSWDETRVIVGEGSGEFEIEPRNGR